MNSDEEVTIPFNRRTLRVQFMFAAVMSLMCLFMLILFASPVLLDVPHMGTLWRVADALMLMVMSLCFIFIIRWALFLGHCLRHNTPAFVFHREGVVDNASGYWVGLIPWTEMARVYPSPLVFAPRFAPRFHFRLPGKRRLFIVILLKNAHDFRAQLPRWKAWAMRLESADRPLLVGERLLAVTVDEFMRRLNGYYIAHVRREGLP